MKAMFGALLLAVLLPASSPALPPAAARLEATVRGLHEGIRADFVQIRTVDLTGEEIEARGFLAFRPPASFRLVYVDPEPQEVVVQGDSLWVVTPRDRQALRYAFDPEAPGSEVFLLFGPGGRSLADVFDLVEEPWADHADALRLSLKEADPAHPMQEMRLLVDENGFPRRLFFREVTGDVVVFDFVRVQAAPPGLDALLRLDLPPGTEVIDGEDLGGAGR